MFDKHNTTSSATNVTEAALVNSEHRPLRMEQVHLPVNSPLFIKVDRGGEAE